jgi:predicted nucleotidyltransferase
MLSKQQIKDITSVIKQHSAVMLAYAFGSRVSGDVGPMSDYDFAIHTEGLNGSELLDLRLGLMGELGKLLVTDKIDLVVLNQIDAPALKYNIICSGIMLFDRSDYRVLVEPRILNDYFDFQTTLYRNGLSKVAVA